MSVQKVALTLCLHCAFIADYAKSSALGEVIYWFMWSPFWIEIGLGGLEDGLDLLYHQVCITVRLLMVHPAGGGGQCGEVRCSLRHEA